MVEEWSLAEDPRDTVVVACRHYRQSDVDKLKRLYSVAVLRRGPVLRRLGS